MNCSKIQSSCNIHTRFLIRFVPIQYLFILFQLCVNYYVNPSQCIVAVPLHDYGVYCIQIDLQHFVIYVTNQLRIYTYTLCIFGWFLFGISRSVLNGHMFVYTELILDDILVYLQTITNYKADHEECVDFRCAVDVANRWWLCVYNNFYFKQKALYIYMHIFSFRCDEASEIMNFSNYTHNKTSCVWYMTCHNPMPSLTANRKCTCFWIIERI